MLVPLPHLIPSLSHKKYIHETVREQKNRVCMQRAKNVGEIVIGAWDFSLLFSYFLGGIIAFFVVFFSYIVST